MGGLELAIQWKEKKTPPEGTWRNGKSFYAKGPFGHAAILSKAALHRAGNGRKKYSHEKNISQSLTESMYIFVMYLFVELSLAIKVLSSFVEIKCLQWSRAKRLETIFSLLISSSKLLVILSENRKSKTCEKQFVRWSSLKAEKFNFRATTSGQCVTHSNPRPELGAETDSWCWWWW